MLEPVQVTAVWQPKRGFLPGEFIWRGQTYAVEDTGRAWEDDTGLHILCMAVGGNVFELIFCLHPAGWQMHTPTPARMA